MIIAPIIATALATMSLSDQSVGNAKVDMHEMASLAAERYVGCLAYRAIRADDGRTTARNLIINSKDKCSIVWSMYKFFVKRDFAAREKLSDAEAEIALGALDEIAVDNATAAVTPLIHSVRDEK